jgi:hypothetical protein
MQQPTRGARASGLLACRCLSSHMTIFVSRARNKGLSPTELRIVGAIILIIATIAIPNLMRARMAALDCPAAASDHHRRHRLCELPEFDPDEPTNSPDWAEDQSEYQNQGGAARNRRPFCSLAGRPRTIRKEKMVTAVTYPRNVAGHGLLSATVFVLCRAKTTVCSGEGRQTRGIPC